MMNLFIVILLINIFDQIYSIVSFKNLNKKSHSQIINRFLNPQPNYKVALQKHELAFDKPMANAELIVTENAGNPVVSFKGELLEDVTDPIMAEIRFLRLEGADYVPVFINISIDICDLIAQSGKHPMISMVMKELAKDNSFPVGCPMKKVRLVFNKSSEINLNLFSMQGLYSMNNFSPNIGLLDMLPPVLPEGIMKQDLTFNRIVNGERKMMLHIITSVQLGSNH